MLKSRRVSGVPRVYSPVPRHWRERLVWPRLLWDGGTEGWTCFQDCFSLLFSEIGQPGWDHLAMTKQKLLLDGTFSLFLIAACEAQQLARSHVAASSGSLCDTEAESWGHLFSSERLDAWICSLIGSFMVGLSGVFPLLVIPLETGAALRSEGKPASCIGMSWDVTAAQWWTGPCHRNAVLWNRKSVFGALIHTFEFVGESFDKVSPGCTVCHPA